MFPYIHIGTFTVSTYQLCLMLAFSVGVALLVNLTPPISVRNLTCLVMIPILVLSLVGAKVVSFILEGGKPYEVFLLWQGGYYFHGGLIGGIVGYAFYLRATGNSIRDGLDWAAPFAALGEAIARLGCFLSGCCWGSVTQSLIAVVYPIQSHAGQYHIHEGLLDPVSSHALPVHPAPLYTAFLMLALYVGLRLVQARSLYPGYVTLHYLTWHCIFRVALEFFRDDMPRYSWGWTATQTTAAVIFLAAASMLALQRQENRFRFGETQTQEDSSC